MSTVVRSDQTGVLYTCEDPTANVKGNVIVTTLEHPYLKRPIGRSVYGSYLKLPTEFFKGG